jgi:hypothetical protein
MFMKRFVFFLMLFAVSTAQIFSQKIGIFYNTNVWADFTYLTTVSSKIENEYKSDLNVIDYCSQTLQKNFTEIEVIDMNPSNMVNIKSKTKNLCAEGNFDYAIVLVHTTLGPDLATDKIRYKMGSKSFGLVAHSMNKKVYYVFFNTVFMLYSKKSDKFIHFDVENYKTYEWFKEQEYIIEDGKLIQKALNDGISLIKQKLDSNLNPIIAAIKNGD